MRVGLSPGSRRCRLDLWLQLQRVNSVIASAAKQSIAPQQERMDCRVASLLAMTANSPSYPAHAGYPVRGGLPIQSSASLEYWIRLRSSSYGGQVTRLKLWIRLRLLAARCARSFAFRLPSLRTEGAGKTGCALHPRSREHDAQKSALTSIQVQRKHSGLPAQRLYGLLRAHPGERALLSPSLPDRFESLMPASRHQVHPTSPYATTAFIFRRHRVHRSPTQRLRRWPTPLCRDGMREF